MLFNTHTHLNSEQLFENRDLYIQNAIDRGVKYFTVVGYDLESSRLAVQIAHEYDFIYAITYKFYTIESSVGNVLTDS